MFGEVEIPVLTTGFKKATTVPAGLIFYNHWICWKLENVPNKVKPNKTPYNAMTGALASSTDEGSWTTYRNAKINSSNYSGVGFCLNHEKTKIFFFDYCIVDGVTDAQKVGYQNLPGKFCIGATSLSYYALA
jgi:primase-polymerase (primpol)-like protein